MRHIRKTRRDFSAARGYQYHYIAACIKHKKELCMSHRQMRAYWGHSDTELYGALCCYSRLLKYRLPCWSLLLKRRKIEHIRAVVPKRTAILNSLADFRSALTGCYLANYVSVFDDTLYFRYDTDDNTVKENESTYYDIQSDLQKFGYTLTNTCIEHDCIFGDVVAYSDS